jgi:hypothetical protein
MELVEIYKLQNNGSQMVLAVCKLVGDGVVCEGNEIFVKNLNQEGIFDYTTEPKEKIFPKDGRKFLEQLKFNFKSGYLNASDIKNKDND